MLKKTAIFFWLVLSSSAFAANTSISNGDSGASARSKINASLNQQFNVMQPPYSAARNGSTDDTTAIQSAITDAINAGGGEVFFPAGISSSQCYKTTVPLTFTGGAGGSRLVTLRGAKSRDSNGAYLCANFGGTSTNVTGAANNGSGAIRLAVTSSAAFATGDYTYVTGVTGTTEANFDWGVTVIDGTHIDLVGSTFSNAYVSGGTISLPGYVIDNPDGGTAQLGMVTGMNINNGHRAGGGIRFGGTVTGEISECNIAAGMVGIYLATNSYNVTVRNCNITNEGLFGTGIFTTQSNIMYNSLTGWDVGIQAFNIGLLIQGNRFEQNTTGIVLGKNPGGTTDQVTGGLIGGNSTERNGTAILVHSAGSIALSGNGLTGTLGPAIDVTAAVWAANVVTLTTKYPHRQAAGTRTCEMLNFAPTNLNIRVTCTFSSTNTITYPLTGSGAVTTLGNWSLLIQYGLRVCNATAVAVSGLSVSVTAEVGGIDLSCGGNGNGSANAIMAASSSGSVSTGGADWIMPPALTKAGWGFVSSNNPTNAMLFANLPGQAGVQVATAIAGMEYNITDALAGNCSDAACGWGANVTGGTGALKRRVQYNGTNWTVMGQ